MKNIHKKFTLVDGSERTFNLRNCSIDSNTPPNSSSTDVFITEDDIRYEVLIEWETLSKMYDYAFECCEYCGEHENIGCDCEDIKQEIDKVMLGLKEQALFQTSEQLINATLFVFENIRSTIPMYTGLLNPKWKFYDDIIKFIKKHIQKNTTNEQICITQSPKNESYLKRFNQNTTGAWVEKLFWIPGAYKCHDFIEFIEMLPEDFYKKTFGSLYRPSDIDELWYWSHEITCLQGFICEINMPIQSKFSFDEETKEVSGCSYGGSSRIYYLYADTIEDLMKKIEHQAKIHRNKCLEEWKRDTINKPN